MHELRFGKVSIADKEPEKERGVDDSLRSMASGRALRLNDGYRMGCTLRYVAKG